MSPESTTSRLGLRLTPHGRLVAQVADDAPELHHDTAARLTNAFARGSGHGLLQLGAGEIGQLLPPVFVWWRAFAARYLTALCLHAPAAESGAALPEVPAPNAGERASQVLTAPMMPGAEYLTPDTLQ